MPVNLVPIKQKDEFTKICKCLINFSLIVSGW